MIDGPCCNPNRSSPCMANGKCTKSFPKNFTNDTITNVDGYPIYRRINTDNGGESFTKKCQQRRHSQSLSGVIFASAE
ncbi:ATP-dependent DNA helicase [Trichonephila clavata]|uniref:ATP-dependent DNA helicase n=1 Tax=Trichonephila clavata TaxID=2740835 RepID=A0A8X6LYC6_TRICU|nr:ATP-dependent DNA helicase [Trichonephila clavata]